MPATRGTSKGSLAWGRWGFGWVNLEEVYQMGIVWAILAIIGLIVVIRFIL